MSASALAPFLSLLLLTACSAAEPAEPDAEHATTLAFAKGLIAHYRYEPPRDLGEQCFDLKGIVRALRSARQTTEQAEWQRRMESVCAKAGKTIEL